MFKFLSHNEARAEYEKSDYINWTAQNPNEVAYKTGAPSNYPKESLIEYYAANLCDFSNDERRALRYCFTELFKILSYKAPLILPNKQVIGLICLNTGVDWDQLYTLNHNIVFARLFIEDMVDAYRKNDKGRLQNKIKTLCHECVHLIQRNPVLYPLHDTIFNHIYTKWRFTKVKPGSILPLQDNAAFHVRTNPDGANYEWLYSLKGRMYTLVFVEDLKTSRLMGVMAEVVPVGNKLVAIRWQYTKHVPEYINQFYGRDDQVYHPNEILAVYLCRYIITGKKEGRKDKYDLFDKLVKI